MKQMKNVTPPQENLPPLHRVLCMFVKCLVVRGVLHVLAGIFKNVLGLRNFTLNLMFMILCEFPCFFFRKQKLIKNDPYAKKKFKNGGSALLQ